MLLSQADSPGDGIASWVLTIVWVCALIGLLIVMRRGIKLLGTLLTDAAGPWARAGHILRGALVLAFALFVFGLAIGIFTLTTG